MERFSVRILERNFSEPLSAPLLDYDVDWYSWNAIGGPDRAQISVKGITTALWEMIEKLRCPIEILNWRGEAVWWGYVGDVTISHGKWEVGVSLDSMYNRVAVVYSAVAVGSATVGTRATTGWSQNDESVTLYGTREMRASLGGATTAQAQALRDTLLAQHKYPIPIIKAQSGNDLRATLNCFGWWSTLNWRYYQNTNTASVVTTTQISAMLSAVGTFIAATDIVNASGISSSEYRDGDTLANQEVADLLRCGTTSQRRLLASVTRERVLRVYEEPASGSNDYLLTSDGVLRDAWDVPIPPDKCPVGIWAKLKDVIPATADVSKLSNPTLIFIEAAEYDAQRMIYTLEPRALPSVWELGQSFAEL